MCAKPNDICLTNMRDVGECRTRSWLSHRQNPQTYAQVFDRQILIIDTRSSRVYEMVEEPYHMRRPHTSLPAVYWLEAQKFKAL